MHSLAKQPTARALRVAAQAWLDQALPAIIITVEDAKGSVPREAGTRMLVGLQATLGTIGGGHLEWQAISLAQHALRDMTAPSANASTAGAEATSTTAAWTKTIPLGPALGQCCGGVVTLRFAALSPDELARWPVLPSSIHVELHGAGHVGQAIIQLLRDIDCTVRWIDMRDVGQPSPGLPDTATLAALPPHITWLETDAPEAEVADAPPSAYHIVLTHRHDLDLRIIEAVLRREDAAFAGLIGSQTKRARFLHRLAEKGLTPAQLEQMACPIGLPGLHGKAPQVIAISVVAQLLMRASNE